MKTFLLLALSATVAVTAVAPAGAREDCGVGYHRGPYGGCRPNLGPGPVVVVPAAPAIGVYYRGRGYWDGNRYGRTVTGGTMAGATVEHPTPNVITLDCNLSYVPLTYFLSHK